jgi:beta-glucosidase
VSPLYPFGYGLSYTTFAYSDLRLSAPSIGPAGSLTVSAAVTNTGPREGTEVAQLYVHDEVASITRPVRALAGFQRVRLRPGEAKRVEFVLTARQLGFYNEAMRFTVEPGRFRVVVGPSSAEGIEGALEVRGEGGGSR